MTLVALEWVSMKKYVYLFSMPVLNSSAGCKGDIVVVDIK